MPGGEVPQRGAKLAVRSARLLVVAGEFGPVAVHCGDIGRALGAAREGAGSVEGTVGLTCQKGVEIGVAAARDVLVPIFLVRQYVTAASVRCE